MTQLIAHDREVYDVAWLPGSTDIFVSVGADGSLRAFDLRSLEHSTILYETPAPKNIPPPSAPSTSARPPTSPLLRISFNPADSNYMSTFHMDGADVQILDMRSPGQPVMELRGHHAAINALGWGSVERPLLATAGKHLREKKSLDAYLLDSRRLSGIVMGSCQLYPRSGVTTQCRFEIKLSTSRCEKKNRV